MSDTFKALLALAPLAVVSQPLGASPIVDGFVDTARVVSAEPVTREYRVNTPRTRCWDETVTRYEQPTSRSYTPEIVGALLGAAVGHQFGSGRGQDAATVAGAVLGGSVGRDFNRRRDTGRAYQGTEERCETYQETTIEQEVVGYDVTYRYHGKLFTARTDEHPGDTIRVRVGVSPVL